MQRQSGTRERRKGRRKGRRRGRETRTVKNLRVVVTVTRVRAEKERTSQKMKNWPIADIRPNCPHTLRQN
eukprot:2373904-Rhodomonas_salina.2